MAKALDNENIYDMSIRLYGDMRGLPYLIGYASNIDNAMSGDVDVEDVVFSDFVSTTEAVEEKVTFKVRENQSIYDLALQMGGSMSGLSSVIGKVTFLDQDIRGTELDVVKNDDEQLNVIQSRGLVFATRAGEAGQWILKTNFWDDLGIWIDTETWND
jgi:hypothetical protein